MMPDQIATENGAVGMRASQLIAKALSVLQSRVIFGVVGIPVTQLAEDCQACGIRFIGFRNEQAASYAACAYGYLSGQPGVLLVVSGPGVLHAMAGIGNAWSNKWPMLILAGSAEEENGFQACPQLHLVQRLTKSSQAADDHPCSALSLPRLIHDAICASLAPPLGPTYIQLTGSLLASKHDMIRCDQALAELLVCYKESRISLPSASLYAGSGLASMSLVQATLEALAAARRPLVILGKGAAFSRSESPCLELIECLNVPFLPMPMAKGLVSDEHPLCVAAARSLALSSADVVLVVGARLNWMLGFGRPPTWHPLARIAVIDHDEEELRRNAHVIHLPLLGHLPRVLDQLVQQWKASSKKAMDVANWKSELQAKIRSNQTRLEAMVMQTSSQLNYYQVFHEVQRALPKHAFIVTEGANTMDIGRAMLAMHHPRTRLDAGTFGTMGIGIGCCLAAAQVDPSRPILLVSGDSAFGFSAFELETVSRTQCPMIALIIDNHGIYRGMSMEQFMQKRRAREPMPSTALSPFTRYDHLANVFEGGQGWYVRSRPELQMALEASIRGLDAWRSHGQGPWFFVIHCKIDPEASSLQPSHFIQASFIVETCLFLYMDVFLRSFSMMDE